MKRAFLLTCLAILLSASAYSAVIYMDDNTVIKGEIIQKSESKIVIQTDAGREEINRKYIKRIIDDTVNSETEIKTTNEPNAIIENKEEPETIFNPRNSIKLKTQEKEIVLKLGADFSGKHNDSTTLNYYGSISGSLVSDVDMGLSLSVDYVEYVENTIGVGVGATYQIPRKITASPAIFNFVPVYAIFRLRQVPKDNNQYLFGTVKLGYNIFNGNSDYTGSMELKNGFFYSLGIGSGGEIFIDLNYSVCNGSYSDSGYYYGYYNIDGNVKYSYINLSIGMSL